MSNAFSNNPEIILDECVYSKRLLKTLKKIGLRVKFFGRGVPDNFIRQYIQNHYTVLITEDRELQTTLGWKKALLIESWADLKDMTKIIRSYVEGVRI